MLIGIINSDKVILKYFLNLLTDGNFGGILEDGTMLNFSDGQIQRDQDHRNIGFFYTKASGTNAMMKFMRRGNIRVTCSGSGFCFEFCKPLTQSQISMLRDAEKIAYDSNIEFLMEKSTKHNGKTVRKTYNHVYDYIKNDDFYNN